MTLPARTCSFPFSSFLYPSLATQGTGCSFSMSALVLLMPSGKLEEFMEITFEDCVICQYQAASSHRDPGDDTSSLTSSPAWTLFSIPASYPLLCLEPLAFFFASGAGFVHDLLFLCLGRTCFRTKQVKEVIGKNLNKKVDFSGDEASLLFTESTTLAFLAYFLSRGKDCEAWDGSTKHVFSSTKLKWVVQSSS